MGIDLGGLLNRRRVLGGYPFFSEEKSIKRN
jgi:hypothetical protein